MSDHNEISSHHHFENTSEHRHSSNNCMIEHHHHHDDPCHHHHDEPCHHHHKPCRQICSESSYSHDPDIVNLISKLKLQSSPAPTINNIRFNSLAIVNTFMNDGVKPYLHTFVLNPNECTYNKLAYVCDILCAAYPLYTFTLADRCSIAIYDNEANNNNYCSYINRLILFSDPVHQQLAEIAIKYNSAYLLLPTDYMISTAVGTDGTVTSGDDSVITITGISLTINSVTTPTSTFQTLDYLTPVSEILFTLIGTNFNTSSLGNIIFFPVGTTDYNASIPQLIAAVNSINTDGTVITGKFITPNLGYIGNFQPTFNINNVVVSPAENVSLITFEVGVSPFTSVSPLIVSNAPTKQITAISFTFSGTNLTTNTISNIYLYVAPNYIPFFIDNFSPDGLSMTALLVVQNILAGVYPIFYQIPNSDTYIYTTLSITITN